MDELTMCPLCGKMENVNNMVWLTSHEGVCPECREKLPKSVMDKIEEVEYNYLPDDVVDYFNTEYGCDYKRY